MDADPTPLVDILSDTQMTVLKSESLDSNQSYREIILDSENLESHQASNIFIERSFIADTDFSNGRWMGLELIELICRNCNAANVDWSGARMTDTEFHCTRLTGCNLSGTNLHNVLFYRCKLDLSLFHDSQLTGCQFQECDLREADFQNTVLKRVIFRDCDLRNTRYPSTSLSGIDLRGSQLAGMHADTNELQGALVDPFQVTDIASMLGLVVERLPTESLNEYNSEIRYPSAGKPTLIESDGDGQ